MNHPAQLDRLALNIFHLHPEPQTCAHFYVDDHVGKIFVECCQMLSTAVRLIHGKERDELYLDSFYRAAYENHPMNVWVRSSYSNWYWTLQHALELSREFTYRFGGIHRSHGGCLDALMEGSVNIFMFGHLPYEPTRFPLCMPDHYKIYNDNIWNYRVYYKFGKSHLHRWTKRSEPEWLNSIPDYQEIYNAK